METKRRKANRSLVVGIAGKREGGVTGAAHGRSVGCYFYSIEHTDRGRGWQCFL